MFGTPDNTYNDIREKSLLQWLDEMEQHDDVAVRCGVRLARDYMEYLKEENYQLIDAEENAELAEKYGVTWWDAWDIGDRTIGSVYGGTVGPLNLTDEILLDGIAKNPDSRYHILNLWQYERFKYPYGLPPCAYETQWNVRHGNDGVDYLDMKLVQRSSDFAVAGCINQVQYLIFLHSR